MRPSLAAALERAVGSKVTGFRSVSGGDINRAYKAELADGRRVFVKSSDDAPDGMFAAEARGLAWLAEAKALRVPTVLAERPDFLVLEWIESGQRTPDFDEGLGRGLAALHRAQPDGFGLSHDNFIGRLAQRNQTRASWPVFYREQRLAPQLQLAVDAGLASPAMRREFDRLFADLERLVGPPEPPARLHGDLWGGNLMSDDRGQPCLIDPAVYGGHREVDLAMMRLFGGFSPRVFAAYDEAYPLSPGHERRVPLYQLYFLMVHVNLFGRSYLDSVERALAGVWSVPHE